MLTLPDAGGVGNTPSDSGWDKFSKPRVLKPQIKNALELRTRAMEAQQADAERERERIDERSDQITYEILQLASEQRGLVKRRAQIDIEMGLRQESLREMRAILLDRGGQA